MTCKTKLLRNVTLSATPLVPKQLAGLFCFLTALFLAGSSPAQEVNFRAQYVRVTVPINSTNSAVITNYVNVADLGGVPVVLSVSGLPSGAAASLTFEDGTPATSVLNDTNVLLTLNTTNIAEGVYNYSVNGSGGATNSIALVLEAAHIWNGPLAAAADWSAAGSWLGGAISPTSGIVFSDLGTQTNSFTNSTVSVDTTVASLRFSHTARTNAAAPDDTLRPTTHTIQIATGKTLAVTGSNGFSFLRDFLLDNSSTNITALDIPTDAGVNVNFVGGGNGSTLLVSNDTANIAVVIDAQQQHSLTMSNLSRFVAKVQRVGWGDYSVYPNFWSYDANDYGGIPRRFIPTVSFARTNIITASYVDPDDYTNADARFYSLTFVSSIYGGTTAIPIWNLGVTNAFLMDSVCLVGANQQGRVQFNPALPAGYALFRSTNGGRMSMFAISDDAGTNYSSSNIKSFIDFGTGGGTVDILADRFIMTQDRRLLNGDNNFQGQMYMGKGTVDVNTAILGYQQFTNRNTNSTTFRGYCQATLTVSNSAVFKVNGTLELGYSVDTDPLSEPFNNRGVINIGPGGTVRANTILYGGPTKSSQNSAINMTGGANLVVSNTIADADGYLPQLNMSDSILTLHVDGAQSTPYVYATNVVCSGISNLINIASITGISSYPTQIALIKYESATANFSGRVPSGQFGFVLNNATDKTIDLYLFTNAPRTLVWRGNLNSTWNNTSLNWVLQGTTTAAAFSPGDNVIFDDTASATTINIDNVAFPGSTIVSNETKNFSFAGGTIAGTATITKDGAAKLTFDSPCENSLSLNKGSVEVSLGGSVGPVSADVGTVFTSSGTVLGLTSYGAAWNGGQIYGPVAIKDGTFLNAGHIDTRPGALSIAKAIVTNALTGVIDVAVGNWSIDAGGTLVNLGSINNLGGRLNVNAGGTLIGTGEIIDPNSTASNPDGRVIINTGALISPGATASNSIGTLVIGGRFDLGTANGIPGKMLIEIDFSNPQTNDMVGVDLWNNMLGRIIFTNINPVAGTFASGQTFLVSSNNNGFGYYNTPDVANQMPQIWPPMPGPGLHWQLADFRTNGIIGITNSLIWRGNVSGNWDTTTANWLGGATYGDGRAVLFDESATGQTTVNIPADVQPGTNPNDEKNPIVWPGLIVSNAAKPYVFGGDGKLSGRGGLYKTGPGTLTLLNVSNDYSGQTIIDGGTLEVTRLASWNAPSSIGNQNSMGSFSSGNRGPVIIDNATLRYLGTNATCDRHFQIDAGGAVFEVLSSDTTLILSGTFSGEGGVTKTGPGTMRLQTSGNNYWGPTTINEGILQLMASGTPSTNAINLAGGALQFAANGFTLTNQLNILGPNAQIIVTNTAVNVAGGLWLGSALLAITNPGTLVLNADISGYSGVVSLGGSSGNLRFNNATNKNDCLGSAAASFDLGTASGSLSNFNGAGLTYDLGALMGGANTILAGRSSNATVWPASTTYSIGANGSNTVFSGKILNGLDTVSVVKVGSGTLTLNGANGYTGPTTVSAGTLGGSGSLMSPVTVGASGTLAPGASIGTLAISNSLALGGTMIAEVSRSGGVLTSDKVVGLTSVTFGGSLVVSNVGPDALQAGDSFQLFNTGGSGNFTSITPALSGTLAWNFEPTTGILSVVDTTARPKLNYTVSGGGIQFNWAGSYKLQVQTNSISIGLSNNWADYPGGGSSGVTVPIDAATGTVFFRLINQ